MLEGGIGQLTALPRPPRPAQKMQKLSQMQSPEIRTGDDLGLDYFAL